MASTVSPTGRLSSRFPKENAQTLPKYQKKIAPHAQKATFILKAEIQQEPEDPGKP